MTWNEYDPKISMLGIVESVSQRRTRVRSHGKEVSDLKNLPLHQFLRVPRCAVLPNAHLSTMGGSCLAHKMMVKLVVFPMMMAGSKELIFFELMPCTLEALTVIQDPWFEGKRSPIGPRQLPCKNLGATGSKELKCASEAIEANKGTSSSLMWPPP